MKSILYVGATLMIGASIYGFVDYRQTSQKKEFTNMYKEHEAIEPVKTVDEKTTLVDNKTVVVKEKKAAVRKVAVSKEESIAGIKPIAEDEKMKASEAKAIENTNVTATPSKEPAKVVKKKRKLSSKLFSRGALDERYIKEEVKLEAPKEKTESVKSENKEQ